MREPMVQIPVRVALITARRLRWLSGLNKGKQFDKLESLTNEIIDAISGQCSVEEIDVASVAAELEERA